MTHAVAMLICQAILQINIYGIPTGSKKQLFSTFLFNVVPFNIANQFIMEILIHISLANKIRRNCNITSDLHQT